MQGHLFHPCGLAFDTETGELTQPVCGCDGVTYQGACMASGHRIAHDGVCGAATCFSNDDCAEGVVCVGECDSVGACKLMSFRSCGVPPNSEPACGCDGVTYQSACQAIDAGQRLDHYGVCESAPFGNTTLRVDTVYGDLELARMDADFGCYTETDPSDQASPDVYVSGGLELESGNDSETMWEGVFDLPLGVCTLTLRLACNGEVLCLGSQNVTIEADTILDVVLPCSAGPAVCSGTGLP